VSGLRELTRVILATPGAHASDRQAAGWYRLKADLLDDLAPATGPEAAESHRQATLARKHAARLAHTGQPRSTVDQPGRGDRGGAR
jgi:hypothetical protein